MIRLERATEAHIAELAPRIRQIDREEIWLAGHMTPEESIAIGIQDESYACYFGDDLALIFGCRPVTLLGGVACPWMIATDIIEKRPKQFLRYCKPATEYWQSRYDLLVNYADYRNDLVKKWVKWLGFTLYEPEPYGPEGAMFCRFERYSRV